MFFHVVCIPLIDGQLVILLFLHGFGYEATHDLDEENLLRIRDFMGVFLDELEDVRDDLVYGNDGCTLLTHLPPRTRVVLLANVVNVGEYFNDLVELIFLKLFEDR